MTNDPMTLLRSLDPARTVEEYSPQRAAAVVERAVSAPPRDMRRRRRGRISLATVFGAFAVVGGGGGLAYAVLTQPASTTIELTCAVGADRADYDRNGFGVGVSMPSISGDPLTDCAAEYQRLEGRTPLLAAYQTGERYIAVMPADWPPPSNWIRLPDDWRNDPVRLELRQRLEDLVEGPQSTCTTADEAEQMVREELVEMQLDGWTVERLGQSDRADGVAWCSLAWVDGGPLQKILIQGVQDPAWSEPGPLHELIEDLRQEIAEACLPLDAAQEQARDAVTRRGFALAEANVTAIVDASAQCTRVDLVPGGGLVIVLRGP